MSLQPQRGRRVSAQGMFANGADAPREYPAALGCGCVKNCAIQPVGYSNPGWRFPLEHTRSQSEQSSSASSGSNNMPRALRRLNIPLRSQRPIGDWRRVFETMIGHCAPHITPPSLRSVRPARSRRSRVAARHFHLVEEQVRAIRVDLPPGFHRQLPKLIDGPLEGIPARFRPARHSWPIRTAVSTRKCCVGLCARTSVYSR